MCNRHAMIRPVRIRFGPLLAATLLTVSLGVQLLEVSGRWDSTAQDTSDEVLIVALVLCIGSALVIARTFRERASLSPLQSCVEQKASLTPSFTSLSPAPRLDISAPLGLRI